MIAAVNIEAAEALAAIHAEAFARGWSAAEFAKLLGNPNAFAFADAEGEGFVLGWAVAGEAEVLTLAVRPRSRRRGLGAALVAAALEAVERAGAHSLHLEVAQDNAPATALYAKLGFVAVGVRRNYYPDGGVNAIVMRRTLPL